MDFEAMLLHRYACKKFSEKEIDSKDLEFVLKSGVLSPSSFGFEPWKFVVLHHKEDNQALSQFCFTQENVATASANIVICARIDLQSKDIFAQNQVRRYAKDEEHFKKILEVYTSRTDKMTQEELFHYASLQCYLACMQMALAAESKKINSCIIGGFVKEKVDNMLGLKAPFGTALILSLGYEANSPKYTKQRRDYSDVVEFFNS